MIFINKNLIYFLVRFLDGSSSSLRVNNMKKKKRIYMKNCQCTLLNITFYMELPLVNGHIHFDCPAVLFNSYILVQLARGTHWYIPGHLKSFGFFLPGPPI